MKKLFAVCLLLLILSSFALSATETAVSQDNSMTTETKVIFTEKSVKYLSAALAIMAATIGSGIAIGRIGAAAMGAISEKPEAAGPAMILTALAEGVCLWGFITAAIIIFI